MTDFPIDLAKAKLSRTTEGRRMLIDEHSSSFKWLMASLLAINAGGMATLSSVDVERPVHFFLFLAGGAFWFGIVASLGFAWRGQQITRRAIKAMSDIELFWTLVAIYGRLDQEKGQSLDDALNQIDTRSAGLFGFFALLAFTVGVVCVGLTQA
jgi:hypothetical protein